MVALQLGCTVFSRMMAASHPGKQLRSLLNSSGIVEYLFVLQMLCSRIFVRENTFVPGWGLSGFLP